MKGLVLKFYQVLSRDALFFSNKQTSCQSLTKHWDSCSRSKVSSWLTKGWKTPFCSLRSKKFCRIFTKHLNRLNLFRIAVTCRSWLKTKKNSAILRKYFLIMSWSYLAKKETSKASIKKWQLSLWKKVQALNKEFRTFRKPNKKAFSNFIRALPLRLKMLWSFCKNLHR